MTETEKRGRDLVMEDVENSHKRKRFNDTRFRLLFHQDSVGRVIGRNGDNLKSCKEHIPKAHVRVPEIPPASNNRDRILMASCSLTDVSRLMRKLAPGLFTAQEGSSTREFNLLIPSALAGAVLGKGGQQLREIRDQYGCRVKMFKDKLPFCDERVLHIQATEDKVENMIEALVGVLTLLQEIPLPHDFIRYTPHIARDQDYMSRDCGGYTKQHTVGGGDPGKMSMNIGRDGQLTRSVQGNERSVSHSQSSNIAPPINHSVAYQGSGAGYQGSGAGYQGNSYQGAGVQMYSGCYSGGYSASNQSDMHQWSSYMSSLPQTSGMSMEPAFSSIPPPSDRYPRYEDSRECGRRSPPRDDRARDDRARRDDRRERDRGDRSRERDRRARSRSPPPMMVVDDFLNEEICKDILIDDAFTSYIIGPRGARISGIRKQTSAMIKIGADDTVSENQRKISISGVMKEVMWATNQVKTLIREAEDDLRRGASTAPGTERRDNTERRDPERRDTSSQSKLFDMAQSLIPFTASSDRSDEKITKEIKIPNRNAGSVIGRKAVIINEIRNFSNCKVLVAKDKEVVGDLRPIHITGTPRDVHLADYLLTAVQQMPRDISQNFF